MGCSYRVAGAHFRRRFQCNVVQGGSCSTVPGSVFVNCNVNSHLASPASQGPRTRPAGSEAGDLGIAWLWLVIVRHPYTSHKPLSPSNPSPFALHLPHKHLQRRSFAPYHRQQTNPRNLLHKMWIVDWCMLMPFHHHPYTHALWPARRISQILQRTTTTNTR